MIDTLERLRDPALKEPTKPLPPARPALSEEATFFLAIGEAERPTQAMIDRLHYLSGCALSREGPGGRTHFFKRFFRHELERFGRDFAAVCRRYRLEPGAQTGDVSALTLQMERTLAAVQTAESGRRAEVEASVQAVEVLQVKVAQLEERLAQAKQAETNCQIKASSLSAAVENVEAAVGDMWAGDAPVLLAWQKQLADLVGLAENLKLASKSAPRFLKLAKERVAALEGELKAAKQEFAQKLAVFEPAAK